MLGNYYEGVGVGVAEASLQEDGPTSPVVGLAFPIPDPPYPSEPDHPDNFEDVFISVSAAKSLLIDLKDAIDSIIEKRPFQ